MKKSTRGILLVGNAAACPDIEYVTGFRPNDPVVFLEHKRQKVLVVREIDAGRARRPGRDIEIATPTILGLKKKSRNSLSAMALALLKRAEIRKVSVPPMFSQNCMVSPIFVSLMTNPDRAVNAISIAATYHFVMLFMKDS